MYVYVIIQMDLIEAVKEGDIVSVRNILDRGGNPNLVGRQGETALMKVPRGRTDIASLLIDSGANIDQQSMCGFTALYEATHWCNVDLVSLLLSRGADPDIQDSGGWTPLRTAAHYGRTRMVSSLLRYGANPNIVDERGQSPLIQASMHGHMNIVSLLLYYDADTSIVDNEGRTASDLAKTEEIKRAITFV